MTKPLPTFEALHEALQYAPDTGALIWRVRPVSHFKSATAQKRWNTRHAGKVAGTFDHDGYILVGVGGTVMKAHRVVWAMQYGAWPVGCIDHINHNRGDNRIDNLRAVSRAENNRNASARSPHPGVYWKARLSKWTAALRINGKQHHLGSFARIEDAIAARSAAQIKHGFHPNHCRTGIDVSTLTAEAERAA